MIWRFYVYISPPFVRPNIGGPSKPGVKDEDASECLASPDSPQKSRIVTEPQALPEPMDTVLPPRDFPSLTFHFWVQFTFWALLMIETVCVVYISPMWSPELASNGAFSLCCYVSFAFSPDWPQQQEQHSELYWWLCIESDWVLSPLIGRIISELDFSLVRCQTQCHADNPGLTLQRAWELQTGFHSLLVILSLQIK